MVQDRDVRPPAAAYSIVVAAIGDPKYFLAPPPDSGICLSVAGHDGVLTTWYMERVMGERVAYTLSTNKSLRVLTVAPYADIKKAAE
jgi:hypothetical protein